MDKKGGVAPHIEHGEFPVRPNIRVRELNELVKATEARAALSGRKHNGLGAVEKAYATNPIARGSQSGCEAGRRKRTPRMVCPRRSLSGVGTDCRSLPA